MKIQNPLKAFCPLLFAACQFALTDPLFQSDLERGETYLAQKVKPGASKIVLMNHPRVKEWPDAGGMGIVEGNLFSGLEKFKYTMRVGAILKGVSGITKPHPQGAEIRTGNLDEWSRKHGVTTTGRKHITVSSQNPLGGNYSLRFEETANPAVFGIPLPSDCIRVSCSFELRLSPRVFERNEIRLPLCFFDLGGNPIQQVMVSKTVSAKRAELTLGPRSQLTVLDKRKRSGIPIKPGNAYRIEYQVQLQDTNTALVLLSADGHSIGERVRYDLRLPDALNAMLIGRIEGGNTHAPFFIDNVSIDKGPFPLPPVRPVFRLDNANFTSFPSRGAKEYADIDASHWQISESNSWLLPVFNSGRDTANLTFAAIPFFITLGGQINDNIHDAIDPPISLPTGVQTGKEYYGRVRHQNQAAQWSEWSEPVRFQAPEAQAPEKTTPDNLPQISDAFFSEAEQKAPVQKIAKGRWLDLHVRFKAPNGWDRLKYADIYLQADPPASEANYWNRGGLFDPRRRYGISFALDNGLIHTRISQKWAAATTPLPADIIYVDEDDNRFERYGQEWIKCRVRLLESAIAGPWLMSGFVRGGENRISPMYRRIFNVVDEADSAGNTERPSPKTFLIIMIAALVFAAALTLRSKLSKKSGPDTQDGPENDIPEAGRISTRIRRSIAYMEENYGTIESSAQVADHVSLSPKYFGKLFVDEVGMSAGEYLNKVRVQKAREMLEKTDLTINDISAKAGFQSPEYFSRVFRSIAGSSPRKFRKTR